MIIFCCVWQLRDSFLQKYFVSFSILYPQQLIENKKNTHKKFLENFRIGPILFPPNLHLEI